MTEEDQQPPQAPAPLAAPAGSPPGVVAYTPSGVAIYEDGIDFLEASQNPDIRARLEEEEELQASNDAITIEERELMADRHEPFTVYDCYMDHSPVTGKDFWLVKFWRQIGGQIDDKGRPVLEVALLGQNDKRDETLLILQELLSGHNRPVKNLMFSTAFVSQGKPFHVVKSWDGQVQRGLGPNARPVPRYHEEAIGEPTTVTMAAPEPTKLEQTEEELPL